MQVPNNEFTEHCTGDMPTMDTAWHYWMQRKYRYARRWWARKVKGTDIEVAILRTVIILVIGLLVMIFLRIEALHQQSNRIEYQHGKMYMLLAFHAMKAEKRDITLYDIQKMMILADSIRVSAESKYEKQEKK